MRPPTRIPRYQGTLSSTPSSERGRRRSLHPCGVRNIIGYEVDPDYFDLALKRIRRGTCSLFSKTTIRTGTEQ
jgi:hypothetical protein